MVKTFASYVSLCKILDMFDVNFYTGTKVALLKVKVNQIQLDQFIKLTLVLLFLLVLT